MIEDDAGRVLFSAEELASPDTGVVRLHPGFAEALRELRLAYGKAMIVNSCCRTAAHNDQVGGHPRSLHVYDSPHHAARGQAGTLAIDVRYGNGGEGWQLVAAAQRLGWSIGVAKTFVHLDRRDLIGLGAPALFTY